MSRILTIVPCGQSKIWKTDPTHVPERAENAYTGAPFKVNKKFAAKFSDKWLILSAKYGFIEPNFEITNYNVTFKDPTTNPISLDELMIQAAAKGIHDYNIVIALGGKDYSSKVREVFRGKSTVFAPATGLPIGIGMSRIKYLSTLSTEKMLKEIAKKLE
jgi:hypothetical protein